MQSPLPVNVRRSGNVTYARRKKGSGRGRGEGEKPSLFPFLPVPYPFKCYLKFDFLFLFLGSEGVAVVGALASQQCGPPGSNPGDVAFLVQC